MPRRDALTKSLAITGTVLVWLTNLAPLILSMAALVGGHRFLYDYLMPAELFPAAILGTALLIWAMLRSRKHVKLISWGFGVAVCLLVSGQALARCHRAGIRRYPDD